MKLTNEQNERRKTLSEDVRDNWPLRRGKNEFLKALAQGNVGAENITRREAILAMCYQCTGGYESGPQDCRGITCPLYAFMPYRTAAARAEMPEEQRAQLVARLKAGRDKSAAVEVAQ